MALKCFVVFVNRKLAVNSQSSVVPCWTVTDKFVAVCAAFLPDEIQYTSNQFIFEGVIEKWWDIFSDSVETSRSYVLLLVEKKLLVQASCVCCKVVYGYSSSQSNLPHCYGNSHAIWDHTVLPTTRQSRHSRPYPSRSQYSI